MDSLELDRSKGSLLPHTVVSAKQNVYFFSPVHFREREIGYLFWKLRLPAGSSVLFETLNTFRTSIEALYGKLILRKKNKQLSQLYIHDSLTGLYNRMAYEKLALPLFQQYMQKGRPVGILFADADHLKYINDNFGHDMGNLAIRSIASVIQQQCPVGSISMRYGGDEFVCVIPDYSQSKIQQLKESILLPLKSSPPPAVQFFLSKQVSALSLRMILSSHLTTTSILLMKKCTPRKKSAKQPAK